MTVENRSMHTMLAGAAIGVWGLFGGLGVPTADGDAPAFALGSSVAHAQEASGASEDDSETSESSDGPKEEGDKAASQEAEDDSTTDADEMSAEAIARRIQTFYKETKDFKAQFKQVYTDVAAGEKKVRWGKVYFKKPGKMRWDYYDGESLGDRTKTLVSDGDVFWIYELEFDQVFKKCLENSQLSTSLKFLMGQGRLLEDFEVSLTEDATPESPELELVPKEPTSKYKKVHFQVDPETFQVDKTIVFDPYGNTNAIDFGEIHLNNNLPDGGFEFEPPEGARLLNREKDCS